MRTDLDPGALPTDDTGAVAEGEEGIEVVDEGEDIPVGETQELTVTLEPGLHIVVGHISREPPDFHFEATVDGMRFRVRHADSVLEGYERRRIAEVPSSWIERVEVRRWAGPDGSVRIHPPEESPESPTSDPGDDLNSSATTHPP